MGVDVRIVRQAATSGLQTFVSGNDVPKAAMFFCNLATSTVAVVDAVMSVGLTDGVRQFAITSASDDNVGTTACSHRTSNTNCIVQLVANTRAIGAEAAFSRWVDGGIEINWTTSPGSSIIVTCVLFFGDNLSAYVGDWAGSTDVTAPNFAVDQVIWMGALNKAYNATNDNYTAAILAVGFADKDVTGINPSLRAVNLDGVTTTDCGIYVQNDSWGVTVELSDFDSQGFTTADHEGGSPPVLYCYLALGYSGRVQHWAGNINTKTASGNGVHTEPGFKPQFVMHLLSPANSANIELLGDTDGAGVFGIGVFTATNASQALITDYDGQTTSDTESRAAASPGSCRLGSKTLKFTLTFVSMDTLGWTNSYSAADASPRYWPTLAIGVNRPSVIIPGGIVKGGIIP